MLRHLLATTTDLGSFLGDVGDQAGIASSGGTPNTELLPFIANLISTALGLLGVVFLLYAVYAGFLWTTAQGSEEKIKKAKQILSNCVIGLVITLAAYSISYFVVTNIQSAAGL